MIFSFVRTVSTNLASNLTATPAQVIAKLREDAAAQPPSYGFAEDPHQVTATGSRFYGYLEYAGGY
jgi:subtilisin